MAKPRRKYFGINTLVESAAGREFLGIPAESLGDRKAYEAVEYRPRERMHVFALRGCQAVGDRPQRGPLRLGGPRPVRLDGGGRDDTIGTLITFLADLRGGARARCSR